MNCGYLRQDFDKIRTLDEPTRFADGTFVTPSLNINIWLFTFLFTYLFERSHIA